jgi:hypothetical protein
MSGIFSPATRQTADCANHHILSAYDLTTQSDTGQAARGQHIVFSNRHAIRITIDKLDAACCAASVPAACVQLIDLRILLKRQDESFTLWHLELANAFDGELRHECFLISIAERSSHYSAPIKAWEGAEVRL